MDDRSGLCVDARQEDLLGISAWSFAKSIVDVEMLLLSSPSLLVVTDKSYSSMNLFQNVFVEIRGVQRSRRGVDGRVFGIKVPWCSVLSSTRSTLCICMSQAAGPWHNEHDTWQVRCVGPQNSCSPLLEHLRKGTSCSVQSRTK